MRSVENAEKQCRKTMLTNFKKKRCIIACTGAGMVIADG